MLLLQFSIVKILVHNTASPAVFFSGLVGHARLCVLGPLSPTGAPFFCYNFCSQTHSIGSMTMASNAPDTSFIHAVLRTCRKWSWKQHVITCCLRHNTNTMIKMNNATELLPPIIK